MPEKKPEPEYIDDEPTATRPVPWPAPRPPPPSKKPAAPEDEGDEPTRVLPKKK